MNTAYKPSLPMDADTLEELNEQTSDQIVRAAPPELPAVVAVSQASLGTFAEVFPIRANEPPPPAMRASRVERRRRNRDDTQEVDMRSTRQELAATAEAGKVTYPPRSPQEPPYRKAVRFLLGHASAVSIELLVHLRQKPAALLSVGLVLGYLFALATAPAPNLPKRAHRLAPVQERTVRETQKPAQRAIHPTGRTARVKAKRVAENNRKITRAKSARR